ncbi:hypothetical protein BMS3Abin17_00757 [archaeon BMS3Abin17]|nr:hypothetical protein BMS3Abin17_00757 [archaeon BMS3Abin17]
MILGHLPDEENKEVKGGFMKLGDRKKKRRRIKNREFGIKF